MDDRRPDDAVADGRGGWVAGDHDSTRVELLILDDDETACSDLVCRTCGEPGPFFPGYSCGGCFGGN